MPRCGCRVRYHGGMAADGQGHEAPPTVRPLLEGHGHKADAPACPRARLQSHAPNAPFVIAWNSAGSSRRTIGRRRDRVRDSCIHSDLSEGQPASRRHSRSDVSWRTHGGAPWPYQASGARPLPGKASRMGHKLNPRPGTKLNLSIISSPDATCHLAPPISPGTGPHPLRLRS